MGSECNHISPSTHYIVFAYLFLPYIKNIMIYKSSNYFIYLWFVTLWMKQWINLDFVTLIRYNIMHLYYCDVCIIIKSINNVMLSNPVILFLVVKVIKMQYFFGVF